MIIVVLSKVKKEFLSFLFPFEVFSTRGGREAAARRQEEEGAAAHPVALGAGRGAVEVPGESGAEPAAGAVHRSQAAGALKWNTFDSREATDIIK